MEDSYCMEIMPLYIVNDGGSVESIAYIDLDNYNMYEVSFMYLIEGLARGVIHSRYLLFRIEDGKIQLGFSSKFYRVEERDGLLYRYYAFVLDVDGELDGDNNVLLAFATTNPLSEDSVPSLFMVDTTMQDIANDDYLGVILNMSKTPSGSYFIDVYYGGDSDGQSS